jgi:hypothetical protein
MEKVALFEKALFGLTVFLNGGLIVLFLYRKNHRVFPIFFVYVLSNFLQGLVLFESYRIWGISSPVSSGIAWGTQAFVTVARTLAVGQICHRVLAKYRGIWALAWRMLFATAAVVLLCSWAIAKGSWQFAVLNANRGMELAIASVIVTLFMFTRYYRIAVEPVVRALATGFFLYSCFYVLNITLLESWLYDYVTLWNLLGTLAFLASLLLWSWALRETQTATTFAPEMLSLGIYRTVVPEINDRLRALNDHLGQFWWVERKRS